MEQHVEVRAALMSRALDARKRAVLGPADPGALTRRTRADHPSAVGLSIAIYQIDSSIRKIFMFCSPNPARNQYSTMGGNRHRAKGAFPMQFTLLRKKSSFSPANGHPSQNPWAPAGEAASTLIKHLRHRYPFFPTFIKKFNQPQIP